MRLVHDPVENVGTPGSSVGAVGNGAPLPTAHPHVTGGRYARGTGWFSRFPQALLLLG